MRTILIVQVNMENIRVKYSDIANRNGSETLSQWNDGRNVVSWTEKEGILLSWSVASIYNNEQRHFIIPVGLVQEDATKKVLVVPVKRITIK